MPSILPDYEYDIFISYRQNDNLPDRQADLDGWVTRFVEALSNELKATLKNEVSIYFDENPHDGLLETHQVDASLAKKLKCLVFIPIISQTYCDESSFAWEHEFLAFNKQAKVDSLGMNINLAHGNVSSRILPVRIHELDKQDQDQIEEVMEGPLRAIDFVYNEPGVNRPLKPEDNKGKVNYYNQINKIANALKELGKAILAQTNGSEETNFSNLREPASTPPIKNKTKITDELIKRNVYQAGLMFIIIGLLVWKLTTLVVDWFDLPNLLSDVTAISLIILFPISITLAWLYENSPSGLIKIGSSASQENPFSTRQKKPLTSNTLILVLMVITMVIYFLPQKVISNTGLSNNEGILENKSIAVLYFDNMSGDPDQEFFSDGITEEIIARLAQVKGLRVISRTSTLVYKGQPLNLKKIANELNVAAVLEGSFRRSGNQIKVTAQLINAETDEHIWAETFTTELKDVFAVQSEIAHEIANKFRVDISPETDLKISEIPTNNLEAYEYFLRGKHIAITQYYFKEEDSAAFYKSREMYEKAIALDPDFAEAYAGLGDLYDANRNKTQENFTAESDSLRHALSKKAISLAPNSSWVNNTRAYTFINRAEPELDSGFYFLTRAFQFDPNNAYNMLSLSSFYRLDVDLEYHSIKLLKRALELDPLDGDLNRILANTYNRLGNIDLWYKYRTIGNELLGESNEHVEITYLIMKNDIDAANALLQSTEFDEDGPKYYEALILAKQGKQAEAQKIIRDKEFFGLRLLLLAGMKTEMIEEMKKFPRWNINNYLALKDNSLWDPYRQEEDFKELINEAKKKYDLELVKYGPFVDEFLNNH